MTNPDQSRRAQRSAEWHAARESAQLERTVDALCRRLQSPAVVIVDDEEAGELDLGLSTWNGVERRKGTR
jgi:hypothetical protein